MTQPTKRIRVKVNCHGCPESYSLARDYAGQPRLIVRCPYCNTEGEIELAIYRPSTTVIFKGDTSKEAMSEIDWAQEMRSQPLTPQE